MAELHHDPPEPKEREAQRRGCGVEDFLLHPVRSPVEPREIVDRVHVGIVARDRQPVDEDLLLAQDRAEASVTRQRERQRPSGAVDEDGVGAASWE